MVSNRPVKRNFFTPSAFGAKDGFFNRQFLSNLARLEMGVIPRGMSEFQNSNRQSLRRDPSPVDTRTNWRAAPAFSGGPSFAPSAKGGAFRLSSRGPSGVEKACRTYGARGVFGFWFPALSGWANFVPRLRRWLAAALRVQIRRGDRDAG